MRIPTLPTAAIAVSTVALFAVPTSASATVGPSPTPVVVSDQVAAPFNLALDGRQVVVADGGMNLVGKVRSDGSIHTLFADQPGASGVAFGKGPSFAFTTTVTEEATFENSASGLTIVAHGKKTYVDTHAFEVANNPDQVNHYGVKHPSKCVTDALTTVGFPVSYTGQVDSHAYSVAAYRDGWIIADAGANALWKVDRWGHISTLAVLPAQPLKITADMAEAQGLPSCVAGVTYAFEPVPTDVEVGRDGKLYVTTLPGGPEDPTLGPRGKLWKVDPSTGRFRVVAGGFLGATNLAIGRHGDVYVAELFGGGISVVRHGATCGFIRLPGVVAVESGPGGALWAATLGNEDPPAPGTIVKLTHATVDRAVRGT